MNKIINYQQKQKKNQKALPNGKQKSCLLTSSLIKCGIQTEIANFYEKNGNESTIDHNIWDEFRAVITGKYIALNSFISKNERMVVKDIHYQLKKNTRKRTKQTQRKKKDKENKK